MEIGLEFQVHGTKQTNILLHMNMVTVSNNYPHCLIIIDSQQIINRLLDNGR